MDHKRTTNAFIGSPVERIEDLRFLRGRGQYVDDLARDGLLHAAILRSPVAHGRIRVDRHAHRAGAARRACRHHGRGYAAHGDVPIIPLRQEVLPAFKPFEQPVIAHGKVRYVGEPIAVVVADSAAPPKTRSKRSSSTSSPCRRSWTRRRGAERRPAGRSRRHELRAHAERPRGDADAAFAAAPYIAARTVPGAAPHRGADGDARPAGRMG